MKRMGLIVAMFAVCILEQGCSGGSAPLKNNTGVDQDVRYEGEPEHPSADRDARVYYFANNFSKVEGKVRQTRVLLYTPAYADSSKKLVDEDQIESHVLISRNMMGALVEELENRKFFAWPQSADVSKMKGTPYSSISQIRVEVDGRTYNVSFDAESYKNATPERVKDYAGLRDTIVQIALHTPRIDVETKVE